MIVTQQAQSFLGGCDLWVCPAYDSSPSRWSANIDWQLNFALSKHEMHPRVEMSLALQKILSKTDLPNMSPKIEQGFTLIPCETQLPAKWILFFDPPEAPQASFFSALMKKAEALKVQNIRVFLPSHWALEKVQKLNLDNRFQIVNS